MTDSPICAVCGQPMPSNPRGAVGDPAYVCPADDATHGAERARIRAECAALLAAPQPDAPDPEFLARLGRECNPTAEVNPK